MSSKKCIVCDKFESSTNPETASYDFNDKKTDWSNWVVFTVCPKCFDNKISDDKKCTCFRCKRKKKLCKSLKGKKEYHYYCSWCSIVSLGRCIFCPKDKIQIEHFRDKLSYDEYMISKQCQDCQDKIFNKC